MSNVLSTLSPVCTGLKSLWLAEVLILLKLLRRVMLWCSSYSSSIRQEQNLRKPSCSRWPSPTCVESRRTYHSKCRSASRRACVKSTPSLLKPEPEVKWTHNCARISSVDCRAVDAILVPLSSQTRREVVVATRISLRRRRHILLVAVYSRASCASTTHSRCGRCERQRYAISTTTQDTLSSLVATSTGDQPHWRPEMKILTSCVDSSWTRRLSVSTLFRPRRRCRYNKAEVWVTTKDIHAICWVMMWKTWQRLTAAAGRMRLTSNQNRWHQSGDRGDSVRQTAHFVSLDWFCICIFVLFWQSPTSPRDTVCLLRSLVFMYNAVCYSFVSVQSAFLLQRPAFCVCLYTAMITWKHKINAACGTNKRPNLGIWSSVPSLN